MLQTTTVGSLPCIIHPAWVGIVTPARAIRESPLRCHRGGIGFFVGALHEAPVCRLAGLRKGKVFVRRGGRLCPPQPKVVDAQGVDSASDTPRRMSGWWSQCPWGRSSAPTHGCRFYTSFNPPGRASPPSSGPAWPPSPQGEGGGAFGASSSLVPIFADKFGNFVRTAQLIC